MMISSLSSTGRNSLFNRSVENFDEKNMVHVRPVQIFKEVDIANMADVELRAFEAHLDTMVDQLGEESTELVIERPRYAHAVMVFANSDEPGELLTASRIKVLDPIFIPAEATTNGHQLFHHYSKHTNATTTTQSTSNSKVHGDGEMCKGSGGGGGSSVVTVDDDIQKALKRLEESRNMLDETVLLNPTFPSQLREEHRTSKSPQPT